MKNLRTCSIWILVILMIMLLSSCVTNKTSQYDADLLDEEYKGKSEEFINGLKVNEFLPTEIIDSFGKVKIIKDEESKDTDSVLFYWRTKEKNSDNVIHKIETQYDDGNLVYYHYKNYSYDVSKLEKPISKEDAEQLAKKFASTFIDNGSQIELINDPDKQYQSLYDPGHVETWTSKDGDVDHCIVVDLDMGSVVLYSK